MRKRQGNRFAHVTGMAVQSGMGLRTQQLSPWREGTLEIFSDGMGTGCSFPHDPQLISSFLQKRRRLLNWDSAEGYEKKETAPAITYGNKELI